MNPQFADLQGLLSGDNFPSPSLKSIPPHNVHASVVILLGID